MSTLLNKPQKINGLPIGSRGLKIRKIGLCRLWMPPKRAIKCNFTLVQGVVFKIVYTDILKAKKGPGRGRTRGLDPVCSVCTGPNYPKNLWYLSGLVQRKVQSNLSGILGLLIYCYQKVIGSNPELYPIFSTVFKCQKIFFVHFSGSTVRELTLLW